MTALSAATEQPNRTSGGGHAIAGKKANRFPKLRYLYCETVDLYHAAGISGKVAAALPWEVCHVLPFSYRIQQPRRRDRLTTEVSRGHPVSLLNPATEVAGPHDRSQSKATGSLPDEVRRQHKLTVQGQARASREASTVSGRYLPTGVEVESYAIPVRGRKRNFGLPSSFLHDSTS